MSRQCPDCDLTYLEHHPYANWIIGFILIVVCRYGTMYVYVYKQVTMYGNICPRSKIKTDPL